MVPGRSAAGAWRRALRPRAPGHDHVRQLHVRDGRAGRHADLRGGVPQHTEGAPGGSASSARAASASALATSTDCPPVPSPSSPPPSLRRTWMPALRTPCPAVRPPCGRAAVRPCGRAALPPCRPAALPELALRVTLGRGLARSEEGRRYADPDPYPYPRPYAARGHLAPQPVHHPRRARHGGRVRVGHAEHAPQG